MDIPIKVPCRKSEIDGKACWLETIGDENSTFEMAEGFIAQNNITLCAECTIFREIIGRGFGRRKADSTLGNSVANLIKLIADRNQSLNSIRLELEQKIDEMALMKIITDALVRTNDLHRALRILLTGVTSGRAFEFNRAGIFLVDRRNEFLVGEYAVGPENGMIAKVLWERLSSISFQDQIQAIMDSDSLEADSLTGLIQDIKIPLADKTNIFVKALWADRANFYRRGDLGKSITDKMLRYTDFNEFVIVPLRTENQPMGIMIADNYYTGKQITDSSILALETLANTCGSFLENTLLHRELSERLKELEHVNRLLRENQNYLIQTQRLTDIGKLATTVAHEFKTPLATIGGYAGRALKSLKTGKPLQHDLEIISSEIRRLETITSELLEYTKQAKLQTRPQSINELVRDALSILEHKLAAAKIKVKSFLDCSEPRAKLDERRIKQVIFNLVDNAIDSMNAGQTLRVSTKSDDLNVILEIEDSGCGVPPEHQDKMFSLFFTTKPHGSGLGLPVSKRIVDDHGGRIEFESALGKGTKFSTYFPRVY